MKSSFLKSLLYSPAALVLLFAVSPAASAQTIISVSFSGTSSSTDGDPSFLSFGQMAGVVPAANFNNADGFTNGQITAGNVVDNTGNSVSGLSLSYNAATEGTNSASTSSANQALLNGFIGSSAGTAATATVSGLTPSFGTYNLYVYLANMMPSTAATYAYAGGTMLGGQFVATGTTPNAQTTTAANSDSGPFTQATATSAGNYLLFSNLTASTFQISANSATGNAPINGFQIVSNTPTSAAPEPSQVATLGIVALGLAGLGLRARKRKASAA